MFQKIDKLQSEVDELLGLCAEAGGVDDLSILGPQAKKQLRLGTMVLQMQDGDLEPRYVRRLEKWLNCDEQALRYYVDFQDITAMLSCHFNKSKFRAMLDCIRDCLPV